MGKSYPEGDFVCAVCDGVIECESCGTPYTEEDFEKLELTAHNRIWNFDYRRCRVCEGEITGYLK